jgi:glycyl-tRNA synthetase
MSTGGNAQQVLKALVQMCTTRGFVFPNSSLYFPHNNIKGQYDYGPLGVELKNNVRQHWWRQIVHRRRDVVGLDASILTHRSVLKTSGHVDGFCDELADCLLSKERIRTDHAGALMVQEQSGTLAIPIEAENKGVAKQWEKEIASKLAKGAKVERKGKVVYIYPTRIELPCGYKGDVQLEQEKDAAGLVERSTSSEGSITLKGTEEDVRVKFGGFVHPSNNSPFITAGRSFNLLFKTFVEPIDPMQLMVEETLALAKTLGEDNPAAIRAAVEEKLASSVGFLRPETAQGVYTNLLVTQKALNLKAPFGIAQVGKSFRNELRREQFLFRSAEFEQMELQFFVHPQEAQEFHQYWRKQRLDWWQGLVNRPEDFRLREHSKDELAHYASGCADIEYKFPWGWGELEGVANRGDYDLLKHGDACGTSMKIDCRTKHNTVDSVVPHVIESASGLDRAVMVFLLDAFRSESPESEQPQRPLLKLHPSIAPIKAAILPLMPKPDILTRSHQLLEEFLSKAIPVKLEDQNLKIGKRYYRHDEIGTPFCITVDFDSLTDNSVTLRSRDTMEQVRLPMAEVVNYVKTRTQL